MAESPIAVRVAHVGVRAPGSWLLDDVSFECGGGEWTLISGPTGAGKSTLLRAINGLVQPSRGLIRTLGTLIPGRSRHEARSVWRQTGTLLQEIALFETKTARENVELALRASGVERQEARTQAKVWLDRVHLSDKLDEYPYSLSGGERQRVGLARAFAVRPRLLLLDEPTSAVDRDTARVILDAVKELVETGTAVVMSSHRIDEILERCHQEVAIRGGRVRSIERLARPTEPEAVGQSIRPIAAHVS